MRSDQSDRIFFGYHPFSMEKKERKKKKSRLLLSFEKLGNKKVKKKVRYPPVGTKLRFAYAVANRETLALLFLDIHIPPIPIPIFSPSLSFKSYLHECLLETLYF